MSSVVHNIEEVDESISISILLSPAAFVRYPSLVKSLGARGIRWSSTGSDGGHCITFTLPGPVDAIGYSILIFETRLFTADGALWSGLTFSHETATLIADMFHTHKIESNIEEAHDGTFNVKLLI